MTLRVLAPRASGLWRAHVHEVQRLLGVEAYDLTVRGVGDAAVQRLNGRYRGVRQPTDVLAFPAHEGLGPGVLPPPDISGQLELGELVLGLPYVQRTCVADGCHFQARLIVRAVFFFFFSLSACWLALAGEP